MLDTASNASAPPLPARAFWAAAQGGATWSDPAWQLRHALRTRAEFEQAFALTHDEREGLDAASARFEVAVTPHFASLCDPVDPACPLRRQVLPSAAELRHAFHERRDPLGEDPHRVAPGLVHKYPDRVLLLATPTCASYCRYCTRARWVASGEVPSSDDLDGAIAYIERTTTVRDVLVSGGDPLLLSTRRLATLLDRLARIDHLALVRIGTRVPVFVPQRIDADLVHALRPRRIPTYVNVHINHARELAPACREALARLADGGVPLGGQAVLLRGINDDAEALRALFFGMLSARVRPYYLFHCDPVLGTAHLRTSVERGLEILGELVGHASGMAVPKYVVDLEGGGKVPLWPDHVEGRTEEGAWLLRGFSGTIQEYR